MAREKGWTGRRKQPAAGQHPCMAEGCSAAIPSTKAFCIGHWNLIPQPLQRRLYDAYGDWARGLDPEADKLRAVQAECMVAIADAERQGHVPKNRNNRG